MRPLDRRRSAAAGGATTRASTDDLAQGSADLPPTDGLRYRTADGSRVVVRPSGTEPKLKCYLEVVVPVRGDDVDGARVAAVDRLERIKDDLRTTAGL